jgi:formylglycine-generating enzyme
MKKPLLALTALAATSTAGPLTYRHFEVEETAGRVTALRALPDEALPRWARGVETAEHPWPAPDPKALFSGPLRYVLPPVDPGEPFLKHNHQPSVTWLPNGDLFAVWYTTQDESGTELTVLASRLRAGAAEWDASSEFFKAPGRNMHGSAVFHDGKGTLHHFNGMAPEGASGWSKLALLHRSSNDMGVTWTQAAAISAAYQGRQQVISGTLLTHQGLLIQACDAVPGGHGGTALWISRDGGTSWTDPGAGQPAPEFSSGGSGRGTIAGIHAGLVGLKDGRLMALGRGDSIDGHMPMSVSETLGETWNYSASPFPPIGGGQRLVLMRLREGPLMLVSFTCTDRKNPRTRGMDFVRDDGSTFRGFGLYAAVSEDEGKTWPIRKLITPGSGGFDGGAWTGRFTAAADNAEHAGYLTATQTPDGVIHLLSSALHYRFNLPWIKTPPPQP